MFDLLEDGMMNEKTISELRRIFGLNLYEVNIWLALLARGVSTAGELSSIGNVPRSRAYDILESLEKKGFVVMKVGKPIQYIAVPPEEVIEAAKKNVEKDAKERIEEIDKLKSSSIMNELNTIYKQGISLVNPYEVAGAIRGRSNIYTKMENMIRKAKNQVIIITTEDGLTRKLYALKNALQYAKNKGVKVKIGGPITNKNKNATNMLKKLADVKNIKNVDGRFIVVDGKEAMLMTTDDKEVHPSYDMGVWINSPKVASTLSKMAQSLFK